MYRNASCLEWNGATSAAMKRSNASARSALIRMVTLSVIVGSLRTANWMLPWDFPHGHSLAGPVDSTIASTLRAKREVGGVGNLSNLVLGQGDRPSPSQVMQLRASSKRTMGKMWFETARPLSGAAVSHGSACAGRLLKNARPSSRDCVVSRADSPKVLPDRPSPRARLGSSVEPRGIPSQRLARPSVVRA